MRVELHCHSCYSKGKNLRWEAIPRPRELVRYAKKCGLGALALTDHNTTKGWQEAKEEAEKHGIIFIPGEEIDTQEGHLLALGISEAVPSGLSLEETLDIIRDQAAISVAPHPFDPRKQGIGFRLDRVDAVEVFNAMALDRISNWYAERYAKKLGKPMTAGSDAHSLSMVGRATCWIPAEDLDGILKQIKIGGTHLQKSYIPLPVLVDWARERFLRSYGQVLIRIAGYNRPKAFFASFLLKSFLLSKGRKWYWLARIGEFLAVPWSGMRLTTTFIKTLFQF